MAIQLSKEQGYFIMGAWDEYQDKGTVERKCPVCGNSLQYKELNLGAYQVTCNTPGCVDKKFRGL